jgi:hypothetical protein
MKILSISSITIGILVFLTGMYVLFVLYPDELYAELKMRTAGIEYDESGSETPDSINKRRMYSILEEEAMDNRIMGSYICLFGGIVAVIMSVITIFKKNALGWIGLGLSVVGLFIGLRYGTHMFSGILY